MKPTDIITPVEIAAMLHVSRVAVLQAEREGNLPPSIQLRPHIKFWMVDDVAPYIESWKQRLAKRRSK